MHDGTTHFVTAYLLLIIGTDANIKMTMISSSPHPCLRTDETCSVLLMATGKNYGQADENLRMDLNRRADLFPLWAWFKHKLG